MQPSSDSGTRNRQRILAALEQRPGLCFRALLRATGLSSGTLRHHVSVLERRGQLLAVAHGHRVLHFTDATPPTPERIHEAVLRDLGPGWKAIYDHVTKHPGQRQGVVLDAFTGQSRSTVQHRLRRLVEMDLLEERPVGLRGVAYVPSRMLGNMDGEGALAPPVAALES